MFYNDKQTNRMAQFESEQEVIEQEPEIKVGNGKADIMIHQLNSYQLMQIMRIIDIHDLKYTIDDYDAFPRENDTAFDKIMFDLINKNDSLPTFMKNLVIYMNNRYCESENEKVQSALEKAEKMEYYFVK